jgi:hypothetical protein
MPGMKATKWVRIRGVLAVGVLALVVVELTGRRSWSVVVPQVVLIVGIVVTSVLDVIALRRHRRGLTSPPRMTADRRDGQDGECRHRDGYGRAGRRLLGADDLEVLVEKEVVGPVHADVVDVVVTVAQLHDAVDHAPGVGSQSSLCGLVRCRPADDRPRPLSPVAGICPTCFDVVGAPRWNGITLALDDVADPLVDCTMTCVALMVVPLVVPSTRTLLPLVTPLFEIESVPFRYLVEVSSSTVTF